MSAGSVVRFRLAACLLVTASLAAAARAENWPQWRGPTGDGVSREKDLPLVWGEKRGLAWKCPLPEWGASTPAIWGDAIFVTSHTAENKLLVLRIDTKGNVVWQKEVGTGEATREAPKRLQQKFHQLHNLASPSPVTDGETVIVHFGNGDLAAFDFAGEQLWKRNLQEEYGSYTIWWGHANSPVLHNGLVITVNMQDSLADLQDKPAESYLVAHHAKTGKLAWKTTRTTRAKAEECDAYTTPVLAQLNDRLQLVVMGGNQLDGYDPATGKQLWYLPDLVGGRTVTGPTVAGDMIFTTRGMKKPILGIKPTGLGELNHRAVVWDHAEGTPDSCCPVVWNELLFTISDDGIARCYHAPSGNVKWKERIAGKYKASPVAAEGRIFFLNTEGVCTVLSATARFDKLVENKLEDEMLASPAISGGRIYLRGKKSLYCVAR